jgi:hypothetical protein
MQAVLRLSLFSVSLYDVVDSKEVVLALVSSLSLTAEGAIVKRRIKTNYQCCKNMSPRCVNGGFVASHSIIYSIHMVRIGNTYVHGLEPHENRVHRM